MILTEIVTKSSKEFFEGVPNEHHRMLVDYLEMLPQLTEGFPSYVRTSCPELFRFSFIMNGPDQFDPHILISSFHKHCLEKHGEYKRIIETGFLDDMREFVIRFLESV